METSGGPGREGGCLEGKQATVEENLHRSVWLLVGCRVAMVTAARTQWEQQRWVAIWLGVRRQQARPGPGSGPQVCAGPPGPALRAPAAPSAARGGEGDEGAACPADTPTPAPAPHTATQREKSRRLSARGGGGASPRGIRAAEMHHSSCPRLLFYGE